MFGAWHHPLSLANCYLLPVTQYFSNTRSFSLSRSTIQWLKKKKKEGAHLAAAKDEVIYLPVPTLPVTLKHTHASTHTNPVSRTEQKYFFCVYYIETPWHWAWWLHHGSPQPAWHTTLLFLSAGISEWRHESVRDTLVHCSNVYSVTECGVTVQQESGHLKHTPALV